MHRLFLETRKLGIMEVDDSGRILEFVEKPSPDATQSRRAVRVWQMHMTVYDHMVRNMMHAWNIIILLLLQCPCFYMFSGGSLSLLKQFLKEKQVGIHVSMATLVFIINLYSDWTCICVQDAPLQQKDATGNFIKYLSSLWVISNHDILQIITMILSVCYRRPVYTKEISGRFDVGGLQSYLDCCEHFRPQRLKWMTLCNMW